MSQDHRLGEPGGAGEETPELAAARQQIAVTDAMHPVDLAAKEMITLLTAIRKACRTGETAQLIAGGAEVPAQAEKFRDRFMEWMVRRPDAPRHRPDSGPPERMSV